MLIIASVCQCAAIKIILNNLFQIIFYTTFVNTTLSSINAHKCNSCKTFNTRTLT